MSKDKMKPSDVHQGEKSHVPNNPNFSFAPLSNPDTLRSFQSFRAFAHQEEENDELTPEDFKRLEYFQRVLSSEVIVNHNYRQEIEKAKNDMQKIMTSKVPMAFKMKMVESFNESLQTKMKCLREINQLVKDMIIEVEKTNNYSTYINLIQRWKDATKFGKNPSTASTNSSLNIFSQVNPLLVNSGYMKNSIAENTAKHGQSFLSNQSIAEEMSEEHKILEEARQENMKLEDVIASLKHSRNFLIMALDNNKDDMMEYQEFVQGKKNVLEQKLRYIEDLKHHISVKSAKKSTNVKLLSMFRSKEGEKDKTDKSISRVNGSVIQDVSGKVSGFLGKMFGNKSKTSVPEKVLPTEFFETGNNQSPMNSHQSLSNFSNFFKKNPQPLSTKSSK